MFFKVLGNKKLREKGEDMINQHGKKVQKAGARLYDLIEALSEKDWDKVWKISKEIDELEQEADSIKDELSEEVFAKGSYLPHDTEIRHNLITMNDRVINQIDLTAETVVIKKELAGKIPEELLDMAKKGWKCTDLLQDAIKYLWTDYSKTRKVVHKLEETRSDVKDLYYSYLEKIFSLDTISGEAYYLKEVAESIRKAILLAENAGDYIKALTFKSV
ncbi:MAG: DUF47 domain-containing protein [Candidatus Hodarchaeales archaeon]|jgi:predicted phosphate transport protein (TIGR00153 family)